MTQNASTRGETACLQSDNAFFNFTEAIRDNSSLFKIGCGCGHVFHAPAARTAGRAEAIWPHNQIRCPLFGKIEHRIQFGLRCGGCSYPPGPDPICPAALFGGSWEEIASERVLMGASRTHAAGTTVEAGLPNIKFSFTAAITTHNYHGGSDATSSAAESSKFNLDASKSNAVYGRSSTVQPAAYYVHIWHRVA